MIRKKKTPEQRAIEEADKAADRRRQADWAAADAERARIRGSSNSKILIAEIPERKYLPICNDWQ